MNDRALYIDGKWVPSKGIGQIDVDNPSRVKSLAAIPKGRLKT
ncbi:hypothetical protein [Arthrobacter sp. S2(2024)]